MEYAVKKLKLPRLNSPSKTNNSKLIQEVKILARISTHKNIVRYFNAWIEGSSAQGLGRQEAPLEGCFEENIDSTCTSSSSSTSDSSCGEDAEGGNFEMDSSSLTSGNPRQTKPFIPSSMLYIQMELCPSMDLRKWIIARRNVDIDALENIDILSQILCGLDHIHNQGVIHRDLKPENIYVKDRRILLGDFGLSKNIVGGRASSGIDRVNSTTNPYSTAAVSSPTTATTTDYQDLLQEITCKLSKENTGTFLYSAPEILASSTCTPLSDIYSLGVIMVELFAAFETGMERAIVLQSIKSTTTNNNHHSASSVSSSPSSSTASSSGGNGGSNTSISNNTSNSCSSRFDKLRPYFDLYPQALEIIAACLHPDPARRPTACELLDSDYFCTTSNFGLYPIFDGPASSARLSSSSMSRDGGGSSPRLLSPTMAVTSTTGSFSTMHHFSHRRRLSNVSLSSLTLHNSSSGGCSLVGTSGGGGGGRSWKQDLVVTARRQSFGSAPLLQQIMSSTATSHLPPPPPLTLLTVPSLGAHSTSSTTATSPLTLYSTSSPLTSSLETTASQQQQQEQQHYHRSRRDEEDERVKRMELELAELKAELTASKLREERLLSELETLQIKTTLLEHSSSSSSSSSVSSTSKMISSSVSLRHHDHLSSTACLTVPPLQDVSSNSMIEQMLSTSATASILDHSSSSSNNNNHNKLSLPPLVLQRSVSSSSAHNYSSTTTSSSLLNLANNSIKSTPQVVRSSIAIGGDRRFNVNFGNNNWISSSHSTPSSSVDDRIDFAKIVPHSASTSTLATSGSSATTIIASTANHLDDESSSPLLASLSPPAISRRLSALSLKIGKKTSSSSNALPTISSTTTTTTPLLSSSSSANGSSSFSSPSYSQPLLLTAAVLTSAPSVVSCVNAFSDPPIVAPSASNTSCSSSNYTQASSSPLPLLPSSPAMLPIPIPQKK